MGLVRTWTGQVARAAGASLLAPLVLLLAAGAVALGGGAGGFGSLGELSSGPTLPNTGLTGEPGAALENAQIAGDELAPPADVKTPPASPTGAIASANPPGPGPDSGGRRIPSAGGEEPPRQTPQPPSVAPPGSVEVTPPAPTAPPTRAPAPAQDLDEVVRGLGEAIREPLQPLTDAIIELLRGPPRP